MATKDKVIVIGLDGVTNDLLRPMMAAGKLPNIAKVMQGGVHTDLLTTIPPLTVPAWASSVTGVNPGKLGMFFFFEDLHEYSSKKLVSAGDIKSRFVWDIVGETGQNSIIVNVPRIYPPQPLKGSMVSYLEGAKAQLQSFPKDLMAELNATLDIDSLFRLRKEFFELFSQKRMDLEGSQLEFFLEFSQKVTEKQAEICTHLMKKGDWSFMMTVFGFTDIIQHKFWRFIDEKNPAYDAELAKRFGGAIESAYKWSDDALGLIMEAAGEDTTVILMSDHGFNALHNYFLINNWLEQKGYLKRSHAKETTEIRQVPLKKLFRRLGLGRLARSRLGAITVPVPRPKKLTFADRIDWAQTQAYYAPSGCGININVQGREPQGSVDPADYDALVSKLTAELMTVKSPETGEPMMEKVLEKKEAYSGPYVEKATDLYMLFKDRAVVPSPEFGDIEGTFRAVSSNDKISGTHMSATHGIFGMCGPHVRQMDETQTVPNITDISPTLLYLLGQAVPSEMDGKVLSEFIKEEYLQANPVAGKDIDLTKGGDSLSLDEAEQALITDALRDLGYVE